jgi:preprotein translocase subunit SecA
MLQERNYLGHDSLWCSIIGGMVLHEGKVEMQTGEGKN